MVHPDSPRDEPEFGWRGYVAWLRRDWGAIRADARRLRRERRLLRTVGAGLAAVLLGVFLEVLFLDLIAPDQARDFLGL